MREAKDWTILVRSASISLSAIQISAPASKASDAATAAIRSAGIRFSERLLQRHQRRRRQRVIREGSVRERFAIDVNDSPANGASLCRKCGCNQDFTAAADVEQRHRFRDDIASERRINFLHDDVETADAEVGHDLAYVAPQPALPTGAGCRY